MPRAIRPSLASASSSGSCSSRHSAQPYSRRPPMSAAGVLRQTAPRPGRIERFDRPFDAGADDRDLASGRFRELTTGDWGIRYYAPVPGRRPEAMVVRVSNELQTQGDKVPFADQVKRIAGHWPEDAYVHAIYWDCQTAKDTRKRGR